MLMSNELSSLPRIAHLAGWYDVVFRVRPQHSHGIKWSLVNLTEADSGIPQYAQE